MQPKLTYIVATWIGPRRASYYTEQFKLDPYFLIKQHLINLSIFGDESIEKIVIVVNSNDTLLDQNLQVELEKINCRIPYEIIIRENTGFSYAAWNTGILHTLQNSTQSDYFFLIEDDYVPVQTNFYRYFLDKFKGTTGGVFQLYNKLHQTQVHAAVSNGMLNRNVVETCLRKYGNIFDIKFGNNYHSAERNQITFLNHIKSESEVCDISDTASIPFYDAGKDLITYYGNSSRPAPIHPVYRLDLIKFTLITPDDADFVSTVRNQYANEYLHTSETYTIDQTRHWIQVTKPDYYIIHFGTVRIGYFRVTNYSQVNKNVYIGADIHPRYTGLKLAVTLYTRFISYLFETMQLNKISLEVLETNKRAESLYKKLGFVYEGQKRKEVYKPTGYVDSIIMSILKEEWNTTNT